MRNARPGARLPQRKLVRLHGWLGLGSMAFVLLLSTTGIILNHTDDLRLDRAYIESPWLLNWYGVESPNAEVSFVASTHRVTLLGTRLYFNDGELAEGVEGLLGAVPTPSFTAVVTPNSLSLVTADGDLVERVDTQDFFPNTVTGVGVAEGGRLILRTDSELYETDQDLKSFDLVQESDLIRVQWSTSSVMPDDHLQILQALYRGRGITVERFVLDLHSGKVFTRVGPVFVDLAGGVFIALSMLGLGIWVGRRRRKP